MGGPRTDLKIRFWAKVRKAEPDKCWLWTGAKTGQGYGHIGGGGRVVQKRRSAWGAANQGAKVTAKTVREIRRAEGSCVAIAARFGLTDGHIWKIRNGSAWKHMP